MITTILILSTILTAPVIANSASETKNSLLVTKFAHACANASMIGVAPIFSELARELQISTNSTVLTNQTLSDATTERDKDRRKNRKRSNVAKTGTFGTRNGPVPTTKKRSVRTSTILRLQREWQQMILSGVAYDWYNQKPIQNRKASIGDDETEADQRFTTSHIWIGPISKHQWYIWHFTFTCHDIGSANDNPYFHGVYHGRIVLSKEYPLQPPISIQLHTPNGRFKTNQNICFTSITNYHPDQWNTNSNIYSMIESLRYHMVTSKPGNEIGAISYASKEQKQFYAIHSQSFRKYVPVRYRPSSRSTTKRTSTTIANRNVAIIDHGHMIQKGYITVPTLDNAHAHNNNTATTATKTNPITNDDHDAHVGALESVSNTNLKSTEMPEVDHSGAQRVSHRKKKTKTKMKKLSKEITFTNTMIRRSLGRRLRTLLLRQCGVWLFALLVLSSSLLHPLLKICIMVMTSMTLLFQNKM